VEQHRLALSPEQPLVNYFVVAFDDQSDGQDATVIAVEGEPAEILIRARGELFL
jgi:hypothetical protein